VLVSPEGEAEDAGVERLITIGDTAGAEEDCAAGELVAEEL